MPVMQPDTPTDVSDSFLGGKLLVATPSIGDPRFDRTVILMCDHSAEHAMGIVINKPVDGLRLPELFAQLGISHPDDAPDRAVLLGGPVDRDRGFVIHTTDYATADSTLPVCDGLSLTATKDVLEAIASQPAGAGLCRLGRGSAGERAGGQCLAGHRAGRGADLRHRQRGQVAGRAGPDRGDTGTLVLHGRSRLA